MGPYFRCGLQSESAMFVNEEYVYDGKTKEFIIPQTGYYQITLAGGSHLGYYQDFYAGTNAGRTHTTNQSAGGVVTVVYRLQKNDAVKVELGNCYPKTRSSLGCNSDTGAITGKVSATAGTSVLYINDEAYIQAAGGTVSVGSATTTRVTDGTAGSTSSNPKYVCTGYSGVTYTGGSGSCINNDTYKAYDVLITDHGNVLSSGLGYSRLVSVKRPSVL